MFENCCVGSKSLELVAWQKSIFINFEIEFMNELTFLRKKKYQNILGYMRSITHNNYLPGMLSMSIT